MVNISFNTSDKKFMLPYSYMLKSKKVRTANPRPKTFASLATQVLRAQGRGQTAISWQNPVANPVLSIEGSLADCHLYRYENGTPLTVNSGTFVNVLRYVGMVAKNGTPEHKQLIKTMQLNVNVA